MRAHRAARPAAALLVTEPNCGPAARRPDGSAEQVRFDQILTHPSEFAAWAQGRTTLRMEDFYRCQRRRLGYLMDGDQPVGEHWNFDADNRLPPPRRAGRGSNVPRLPAQTIAQFVFSAGEV